MSESAKPSLPGFEFLQSLMQNTPGGMTHASSMMQTWFAPTFNVEELGKRIDQLRSVQFWLEQNTQMIAATIQALEVQKMTLVTLRGMNVQMDSLREAMTARVPTKETPTEPPAAGAASATAVPAASSKTEAGKRERDDMLPDQTEQPAKVSAFGVDPMIWWQTLTQQFSQLAQSTLQDKSTPNLTQSMLKQGMDGANEAMKTMGSGFSSLSAKEAKESAASPAAKSSHAPASAKSASPKVPAAKTQSEKATSPVASKKAAAKKRTGS
jgi:hypothetical protein